MEQFLLGDEQRSSEVKGEGGVHLYTRLSYMREGARGTVKAQIPFSPLNSLFICLYPIPPASLLSSALFLPQCLAPSYIIVLSVADSLTVVQTISQPKRFFDLLLKTTTFNVAQDTIQNRIT